MTSRGAFPMAHDYFAPATYTISVAATDLWGVGSTSVDVTVGTGLQNCFYRASPKPIAKTASLRPGDHVGVVVSVTDAAGNVLVEPVWISFRPTTACPFVPEWKPRPGFPNTPTPPLVCAALGPDNLPQMRLQCPKSGRPQSPPA